MQAVFWRDNWPGGVLLLGVRGPACAAKGLPTTLSSSAGASALLQRTLPGSGAEMVALEGAATISGDGSGATETEWSKPSLPGAGAKPERSKARST